MRTMLSLLLCFWVSTALADQTYKLNIDEQELGSALKAFAEQSGLQVVYYAALDDGKKAPALHGEYTETDALNRLLADSDLTYTSIDERTYTIAAAPAATSQGGGRDSGNASRAPEPILIAQNQATSQVPASADEDETRNAPKRADQRPMEEILVTGTLIRGMENLTAPIVVLDREYIESTGFSTTSALIESLPQNFALANQASSQTPGSGTAPRGR